MTETLQQIMVALDFSPASLRALEFAVLIAQKHRAQLHIVHVTTHPDHAESCSPTTCGPSHPELSGWLAAAVLHRFELKPRQTVRRGYPPGELLRWLQANPCQLLVMGRTGHSGWKGASLGSTAGALIREAQVPLLLIPASASAALFQRSLLYFRPFHDAGRLMALTRWIMTDGGTVCLQPSSSGTAGSWRMEGARDPGMQGEEATELVVLPPPVDEKRGGIGQTRWQDAMLNPHRPLLVLSDNSREPQAAASPVLSGF